MKPFLVSTRTGAPFAWKPGRMTVICFCAMWCNTWKDQLPRLSKAETELRGLPVDYLAISIDGRWMERAGGSQYASLLADPGGRWTGSIGINKVPYTLVVDTTGVVRSSSFGVLRSADIVSSVRTALHPASTGPIYLTFDGVNDAILDVLRAEGIRATFFCDLSHRGPAYARANREGHSVQALASGPVAGVRLYREPGSSVIRSNLGEPLKLFVDDPFDLTRPGESELERRILNQARPRAQIHLHAGVSQTVSVLPSVIDKLRARGFKFEILVQL